MPGIYRLKEERFTSVQFVQVSVQLAGSKARWRGRGPGRGDTVRDRTVEKSSSGEPPFPFLLHSGPRLIGWCQGRASVFSGSMQPHTSLQSNQRTDPASGAPNPHHTPRMRSLLEDPVREYAAFTNLLDTSSRTSASAIRLLC